MKKIGVLGAGSWGTALTWLLTNNGHEVTLWSIMEAEVEMLRTKREHTSKLPGVKLQESIQLTSNLEEAMADKDVLVKNSLVSSGCIINGQVENSVLFKKVYVGNNCVIKNSIILNDVYLGDNTHIENCIVESRDTIRANSYYCGEGEIKVVVEKNERYAL